MNSSVLFFQNNWGLEYSQKLSSFSLTKKKNKKKTVLTNYCFSINLKSSGRPVARTPLHFLWTDFYLEFYKCLLTSFAFYLPIIIYYSLPYSVYFFKINLIIIYYFHIHFSLLTFYLLTHINTPCTPWHHPSIHVALGGKVRKEGNEKSIEWVYTLWFSLDSFWWFF